MKSFSWAIFAVSTILLNASCTPIPEDTELRHQSSQAVSTTEDLPWAQMTHVQRLDYMRNVVMPRMRTEFAKFDSAHFGKINCTTCHGDGVKAGTFAMPNPGLPKLPNSPDGFKAWMNANPEMYSFMVKTVKPVMADLLKMPQFNPATNSGFGCTNCHTRAE